MAPQYGSIGAIPESNFSSEATTTPASSSLSSSCSEQCDNKSGEEEEHELRKNFSLFDLTCVGVGGTIGSGVFVLTGLIAHDQAGPAAFVSWTISGLAASLSGLCFAELGGRFPAAGSSYVYARETMGERAAVVAAACLTLEYLGSAGAVARSWGDKVVEYVRSLEHGEWQPAVLAVLDPGLSVNPCAFLISVGCMVLLLNGVEESKRVTNVMTTLKVLLVLFMALMGLRLARMDNLRPLVPPEFGLAGILRGATSSFFGYIGFDEITGIAGEATNPVRDTPRAIILSLFIVTVLQIATSLALVGMVPYTDVSDTSGFPDGFRYRGYIWASQICAIGEILCLPLVVLVSFMTQPRLQYALAKDGLLPRTFAQVNEHGTLTSGTRIAGVLMITVATAVPFTYLNDLISAGTLLAFTMTDTGVVLIRHTSPADNPFMLQRLLMSFHASSFLSGLLIRYYLRVDGGTRTGMLQILAVTSFICVLFIGNQIRTQCPKKEPSDQEKSQLFLTPFVPVIPLLGSFINIYLISQLETTGLILIFAYVGCALLYYLHKAPTKRHVHEHCPDVVHIGQDYSFEPVEKMISLHEANFS